MTAPVVPLTWEPTTLDEALKARDEGIAQVEAAADDQDRAVIDQAIREVAARGVRFSANDVRPLLPAVRPALIGARFLAAANRKEIRRVGYVKSTDPKTHAHPIAEWIKT